MAGRALRLLAAARAALETKLAKPLGLSIEEAALGMLRIAVAHMTLAVRGVSIERGYDPRDFVMIASGGNGGLHAGLIARDLGVSRERVRQVEAKAIRKLQHPVRARKLEGFLPGGLTR